MMKMGVQDLQAFLESASLEGGAVSVDLLKIARNITHTRQQPAHVNRKARQLANNNKLKLIVDAESCLDRLYGGYFSDWSCGGQWNRMFQFLTLLMQAAEHGNIELAVVFDGTLDEVRMTEWVQEQANIRQRVGMVLKHINTKATPPPKIWWTPPTCLRTALRMALRHLGVTVMCTMDDHHQEVIAYCREYGFHGLVADDAEYAAFDPPRYFSAENLKLTYKGSLETKEFMIPELHKTLQLSQDQVCVLVALLGNFLLPESELQDVYKRVIPNNKESNAENRGNKNLGENRGNQNSVENRGNQNSIETLAETRVKSLAEFVRTLPLPSNMDALVVQVFGALEDKRAPAFRQSVQYYLNGTASGFLKYCSLPTNKRDTKKKPVVQIQNNNNNNNLNATVAVKSSDDPELDTSGFASETTEQEQESLQNYKLATANLVMSSDIVIGMDSDRSPKETPNSDATRPPDTPTALNGHIENNGTGKNVASGSTTTTPRVNLLVNSSNSSDSTSPRHNNAHTNAHSVSSNPIVPSISPDVLRTASLRHQKGLMSSFILHVLNTRTVRLPCLMEDTRDFPPIHDVYMPLRQKIYAVLFNLHHVRFMHSKKKEAREIPENSPPPDVIVKEWNFNRSNPFQYPELVKAEPLPWAVPTLQRLWFGPSVEDKCRRMRALLSCLNSDVPLMLNTSYVPQHMLLLACVLRYIMSLEKPILRRQELDAILCHAFNPDLMNAQYLQELTLNVVASRGCQLAALFMQGIEMALLANDACGAPVPWLLCCPWLYFDGKLFHHTLARAGVAKNLLEICENHIDRVVKVERMRKAILEGLDFKFAKLPLPYAEIPPPISPGMVRHGIPPPPCLPTLPLPSTRGAAGLRQRPVPSRGGQLQVGGVVVGSWGANYGYGGGVGGGGGGCSSPRQPSASAPPMVGGPYQQGGVGRGRGVLGMNVGAPFSLPPFQQQQQQQHQEVFGRGRMQRKQGPPTYNVNKKNNQTNKKRTNNPVRFSKPANRGRGMTIRTDNGDVPASEVMTNDGSLSAGDESTLFEDCLSEQHQGQGDGPPVDATLD